MNVVGAIIDRPLVGERLDAPAYKTSIPSFLLYKQIRLPLQEGEA